MSNEQGGGSQEFSLFSVFISILIFDLQIYNLFRTHQLPAAFLSSLIRYTATSLLTAHCSLLIASHRHTATPPHRHVYTYPMSVKCKKVKIIYHCYSRYKMLIINNINNIIIYNNIIYFYSIVSFSTCPLPNVRTGRMWRCGGVAVWRMSSEQSNEQLAISNQQ